MDFQTTVGPRWQHQQKKNTKDRKTIAERQNPISEYCQPLVVLRRLAPASTLPTTVLGIEISKAEINTTRILLSVTRNTTVSFAM